MDLRVEGETEPLHPLDSAYCFLLMRSQRSPYIIKYIQSKSSRALPGKQLIRLVAMLISDIAPEWDTTTRTSMTSELYDHYVSRHLEFLQLLLFNAKDSRWTDIPKETTDSLRLWFLKWSNDPTLNLSSDIKHVRLCKQLVHMFDSRDSYPEEYQASIRRSYQLNIRNNFNSTSTCSLPDCSIKNNLKGCKR